MSDDLERQLDEFYRKLDGSARRVEARWKATRASESRAVAAWLAAGVAAAATILLLISALRTEPKRNDDLVINVSPQPIVEPAPRPRPVAPAPSPKEPAPSPVLPTPEPPRPETAIPPTPAPEPPKSAPAPAPEPQPEPSKRESGTATQVVRAKIKLKEAEGTFELGDKSARGRQKDLEVAAGDRLRASTPVKITLGDDRFVLLAPRSVVEFRPEEKRLSLGLEQGELIADLLGGGPELRVVARACEVVPQGTVFGVKLDATRVVVTVEKGRVEVQSPKGRASLRAAESLQASEDGALGTPAPADFRSFAWARTHRAPETTIFFDDFSKANPWAGVGEIERGVARAVAKPGSGATLQLVSEKPPLFEVPVRGTLTLVCRADRQGKFKVQLYSPELKTTYAKTYITIPRGETWRTITLDFDELVASDKSRPARMTPGAPVTDFLIMYGEEGDKGNFWVGSIKVTELRP
jgi:ferric-dicitrate binding protein FerR (iron transport regulator)